jgi:hypothetical protein
MPRPSFCALLVLATLPACSGAASTFDPMEASTPPVPVDAAATTLVNGVDQSIHELITCGAAQRNLVTPMAARVLLSASDAIDEEALEDLEWAAAALGIDLDGDPLFEQDGGTFRLPMGETDFVVRFRDTHGEVLRDDPFVMDSYLRGVEMSSRSWEEIVDGPLEQPHVYTYAWEEQGPLAYTLEPLTNPVEVNVSLLDLVALSIGLGAYVAPDASLGSFASLLDLRVEGDMPMVDDRQGVWVTYDARIESTVGELVSGSSSNVEVATLDASFEGWTAHTTDVQLSGHHGSLAGQVRLRVDGPEQTYEVELDFGDGSAYPEQVWSCIEGCLPR